MAETHVHVGNGGKTRSRWFFPVLVALVVAVSVMAGIGLRLWQGRNNVVSNPTYPRLPAPVEKAQNAALGGDFATAHKTLEEQLAKSGLSVQETYDLNLQQGATYQNEKKYTEALASYKQAAAAKETSSVYAALALVSEQLGDKPGAIVYYKKAIVFTVADPTLGDEEKATYETQIRILGGQP